MIIVSACLCGDNCKYDGKNNYSGKVMEFLSSREFIKVCPEIIAGLGTPRTPCEIRDGKVISMKEDDLTEKFIFGARQVLELAIKSNCTLAILKDKSPSCGVNRIHDGTFKGVLMDGMGFTASLLRKNGFKILSELDYED